MPEKLSPEAEAIAAYGAATIAAFQVLALTLQTNGALEPWEFPEALRKFMEMSKDRSDPMTLAILHDLRISLMD